MFKLRLLIVTSPVFVVRCLSGFDGQNAATVLTSLQLESLGL